MERALGLLQDQFFWLKIADDVRVHIRSCKRCMCFKQPQEKVEMLSISVTYPLYLVHVDFLSIGKQSDSKKNINVLVITDHFTKYAAAYITPNQTAPVVAKTLWENFLVNYGWPKKILSEQGQSFENNLVRELWNLAQVQKLRTTPYRVETNGQCERFNQMLINMLGTLPTHTRKNWQEWVSTLVSM